jgi:hypothetical protein
LYADPDQTAQIMRIHADPDPDTDPDPKPWLQFNVKEGNKISIPQKRTTSTEWWIRIGFNMDPDPPLHLDVDQDPDPVRRKNADPDTVQWSDFEVPKKNTFLKKNIIHKDLRYRSFSQIRDCSSRIRLFPSWIPDPNSLHPGSRIHKELKYFNHQNPKKWFLSSKKMLQVVHPGSGS